MAKNFVNHCQVVPAIIPVNLATAANNGDWVSMRGYKKCVVVVYKDAGAAGEPPVITLQQATAVAGTSAKALNFTKIWTKVGTLTGVGTYTLVTQAAGNTYTDTGNGDKQAVYIIEIDAAQLDSNNNFDCVQVSIPDVGSTAQIGCAFYILTEPSYPQETVENAIVD